MRLIFSIYRDFFANPNESKRVNLSGGQKACRLFTFAPHIEVKLRKDPKKTAFSSSLKVAVAELLITEKNLLKLKD